MALNVYLTFYSKFDTRLLQVMELRYICVCYGVPFVPALIFLCVRAAGINIYGNAFLWCWISDKYAILRIATFYAPIW